MALHLNNTVLKNRFCIDSIACIEPTVLGDQTIELKFTYYVKIMFHCYLFKAKYYIIGGH